MEKNFEVKKEGTTLMIMLGEELTESNAPSVIDDMLKYSGQGIEKVIFDATDLVHIASGSLKTIYYAHHHLGNDPEVIFVNCDPEIKEVLEYIGLYQKIKFEENEEMRKNFLNDNLDDITLEDLNEKAKERRERLDNFKAHNDLVCNGIIMGKEKECGRPMGGPGRMGPR